MVRRRLLAGLTVLLLFASASVAIPCARAQRDTQLWLSAQLRLRLHRRVQLDIEQGVRFDEDISHLGRVLPEVGLGVRVADWLRLTLAYRVTWVNDNNPDVRHRLQGDARFSDRVGHFGWLTRVRYQATMRDGRDTRHVLRGLFGLFVPNESVVTPFVSTEVFSTMGHGDGVAASLWRGTVGVEFGARHHELALYYRTDVPLRDDTEATLHILGVSYGYEARLYSKPPKRDLEAQDQDR